jgi:GAF domain-containing protein
MTAEMFQPRVSLDAAVARRRGTAVEVLARVAQTVSGTANLDEALGFVVHATRELLGADRATILLLDPEGLLTPAVSAASHEDAALYRQFRTMTPFAPGLTPEGRALLEGGRAIAIARASESPLVPSQWQEAFGLESLALVPIVARGEPCGVLVVDAPGAEGFTAEQLLMLEGVAASASIAVRNARDYTAALQRSERLHRALAMAEALNGAPDLHSVTQLALDGLCAVFGADFGSLHVLSEDLTAFTTLASRGAGQPRPGRHLLSEIDPAQLDYLRDRWAAEPTAPVVYDSGHRPRPSGAFDDIAFQASGVLLPLSQEGRVRGFAVVGRSSGEPPTSEELQVGGSVAGQVWLALERARLATSLQDRVTVAEVLNQAQEDFTIAPDITALVERLAPVVREATGGELVDARIVGRSTARRFGAQAPSGRLLETVRYWQRIAVPEPAQVGDLVAVPMLVGSEIVGLLRVRSVTEDVTCGEPARFLLALGAAAGELVVRTTLRHTIIDTERNLAVAQERDRIGEDLHGNVGGLLAASLERLRRACRQPAELGRHRDDVAEALAMLAAARQQIRDTSHGLSSLRQEQRGLVPALRELGRMLAEASGASVDVRAVGAVRALSAAQESVLLRVTHEAIVHLERQSRASVVCLRVRFEADRVELTVRDNGVALGQRTGASGLHAGLRVMKQRLADLGGHLVLSSKDDPGFFLTAVLPTDPGPAGS